jgi:hypothetical protein
MERQCGAARSIVGLRWLLAPVSVSLLLGGGLLWLDGPDSGEGPLDEDHRTVQTAREPAMVGEWSMSNVGDGGASAGGMTFHGDWREVVGTVGGAVEFTGAPSSGVARGTGDMNPGARDFAMSLTFTVTAIPAGAYYSGNLMQKGRYGSPGQVKLQVATAHGGSVNCFVKGSSGEVLLPSGVRVDDGRWHTASCWREGSSLGLTVDGRTRTDTFNAGTIASREPVRVGNRSETGGASDQHFGANDCSVYLIGANARADAARLTPC